MEELNKKKFILTTLNGRYHHTSLALRYLLANLKAKEITAQILEFTIEDSPQLIIEKILSQNPDYLGISVAIWNATQTLHLVKLIREIKPELTLILGGPEFATQAESHPLFPYADYIIEGEGEEALNEILSKERQLNTKIYRSPLLELPQVTLPYELYSKEDLEHRFVYVETTRGCPYRCVFCLSSLAPQVRYFPLENIFPEFAKLIDRGAKHFKFIDRTFNINNERSLAILDFFLPHKEVFLHFEIVPEILTETFINKAAQFEQGRIQFEMGVQTLTPHVAQRIDRYLDLDKLKKNMELVLRKTQIHIHADLIVGLPGENFEEIEKGFNQLFKISPHEIQLGVLKLLRGTPIEKHLQAYQMKFSPLPPYEILKNSELDYFTVQNFKRMARYLDLLFNHGNFPSLKKYLRELENPFGFFWDFSSFAFEKHPQSNGISLKNLKALLEEFLQLRGFSQEQIIDTTCLIQTQKKESKTIHSSRQNKSSH